MGKRGLFSALGYLGATERGPRTTRPDGQPVQRPFGVWSEAVHRETRRRRAERQQPLWPRLVGWSLVGIALVAAVRGEYPVPRQVPAHLSTAAVRSLVAIEAAFPVGISEGVPVEFGWRTDSPGPFTVVLSDGGYTELDRVDGIEGLSLAVVPEWQQMMGGGGVFHWQVLANEGGRVVRSRLAQCEIR